MEGNKSYIIICGMARTGTTLALTLLDSHPDLIVFSEELRFHELGLDIKKYNEAVCSFFSNGNIKKLSIEKATYDKYLEHGGTGFGTRDYTDFNYKLFYKKVTNSFEEHPDARTRLVSILRAFKQSSKYENNESNTYVFKAPHSELYIRGYENMFAHNARYILCTRDPLEQFASFKNIAKLQGRPSTCPHWFVKAVRKRKNMWKFFPDDRTFILDYNDITTKPEETMRKIADFIGVPFNPVLLKTTKYGSPWLGNSSRGKMKDRIQPNKKAPEKGLTDKEITVIKSSLKNMFTLP